MKASLKDITKLRSETSAGIMDCKRCLQEAKGDYQLAKKLLRKKGLASAAKKSCRETKAGIIESYTHLDGRIGVLVKLTCETDFVARNQDFRQLAHELCLQVASMNPKTVEELLEQEYIRDCSLKIKDLVNEAIAKMGENIKIEGFERMQI